MPDWTIPYDGQPVRFPTPPTPPVPLRRPCRRAELRALLERRRLLWAELGDLDAMIVGLVTEIAEGMEDGA